MKPPSQPQGRKRGVKAVLRDIAFWTAVSLAVVCLSRLHEWLDSIMLN